jgi:hypothetical protein
VHASFEGWTAEGVYVKQSKDLPAGLMTVLLSGAIHFLKPPSRGDVGSTPGWPGIRLGISFFTCRHECILEVCCRHPVSSLQALARSKRDAGYCQPSCRHTSDAVSGWLLGFGLKAVITAGTLCLGSCCGTGTKTLRSLGGGGDGDTCICTCMIC